MLDQSVVDWLSTIAMQETPPVSIRAFNIGLFETEHGYCAYLIGAENFDPDDADWACDPVFAPKERYLHLPRELFERAHWETVQSAIADAVQAFLASEAGKETFFATAQAVTVGFDDGDLIRIKSSK